MKLTHYVIAIALSASSAVACAADAMRVTPPQQKMLASSNGRFVFGQISEYRRDQFMLDTQTGRLWVIATRKANQDGSDAPGDGFSILDPVPYSDIDGKLGLIPR